MALNGWQAKRPDLSLLQDYKSLLLLGYQDYGDAFSIVGGRNV